MRLKDIETMYKMNMTEEYAFLILFWNLFSVHSVSCIKSAITLYLHKDKLKQLKFLYTRIIV